MQNDPFSLGSCVQVRVTKRLLEICSPWLPQKWSSIVQVSETMREEMELNRTTTKRQMKDPERPRVPSIGGGRIDDVRYGLMIQRTNGHRRWLASAPLKSITLLLLCQIYQHPAQHKQEMQNLIRNCLPQPTNEIKQATKNM